MSDNRARLWQRLIPPSWQLIGGPDLAAVSAAELATAEALVVLDGHPIGAADLEHLPALRLIVSGDEQGRHLDLDACRRRGIATAAVPRYSPYAIAEHAFALILGLSRRLLTSVVRPDEPAASGIELWGRTLGIVGAGAAGRHLATIGRGFGMRVLVHDPAGLFEYDDLHGLSYAPLTEVLRQSDVLVLHEATGTQLGTAQLGELRQGCLLAVLAAEAVDLAAGLSLLEAGRLGGLALDMTLAGHLEERLASRPDVIVTPKLAPDSREAQERQIMSAIGVLSSFRSGGPLPLIGRGAANGHKAAKYGCFS